MNSEDEIKSAQKVIEIAERLEALTKKEGWQDYVQLIDQVLQQEMQSLAGQALDNSYYKKIGFLQMLGYIKELPTLVKDKKVREYLLHQGRAKACDVAMGLPALYRKHKMIALQKLQQMLSGQVSEASKEQFHKEVFKQS
jgi:hypothetical protein